MVFVIPAEKVYLLAIFDRFYGRLKTELFYPPH